MAIFLYCPVSPRNTPHARARRVILANAFRGETINVKYGIVLTSHLVSQSFTNSFFLVCATHIGINQEWVEPASPIELITSRRGNTPGTTVLCELLRDFYPVISPSFVAEGSRSGEGVQFSLDGGCLCLQMVCCPPAPCTGRCG